MNFTVAIDRTPNSPITAEIAHNLQTLWHRKKGEKLCTTTDGKLITMNLPRRIRYACSSHYRCLVQNSVQIAIKNLTDNINSINLTDDSSINKDKLIADLFFKKLAPLSIAVYSRTLNESVLNQLRSSVGPLEEMEKAVSQEYVESYQEAKLWAKLGNITSMGGASGSYRITQGLVTNAAGVPINDVKYLGIFKPSDEEPLAASNTRTCQKIKRWLLRVPILSKPFRGSMLRTVGGQAYLAEAATKIVERYVIEAAENYLKSNPEGIDERLQGNKDWLKLVTDTQVARLDIRGKGEQLGSFQLWVQEKNHSEASLFFGLNELYQNSSRSAWKRAFGSFLPILKKNQPSLEVLKQKLPAELFELLVIMDFVTGNGDRHADNWFVLHSDDEGRAAEGIRLIDGGQSMAPKHPTRFAYQELHNRYLWRNLALAREEFTPLGKFIVDELVKHEFDLSRDIHRLYSTHQPNERQTTLDRLSCMKDRIKIMAHCTQHNMTKYQLARIRTQRHIAKVKALFPKEVDV